MIEIEYFGGNSVKITTPSQTVVADPKRSIFGLDGLSVKGLIELNTENNFASSGNESFLQIDGPGEYEVANFSIRGFATNRQTDFKDEMSVTNYAISVGGVNIVVLGNIANDFGDAKIEELGVADILLVPIGGGGYTIDAKTAGDLVTKFDAKVVIPLHYADDTLKYEVPQDAFELFANELGSPVVEMDKYKIKKVENLPASLEIVKLKLKTKA